MAIKLSLADNRIGSLPVNKGRVSGKPLISFDVIPPCNRDMCNVREECDYEVGVDGKCRLQQKYIMAVTQQLVDGIENKSPAEVLRIGMHLMPLYGMLVRMKMAEYNQSPIYTDDKGVVKANPIFKEIRETIKVIEGLHKTLGAANAIVPPGTQGSGSGLYEAMFSEE